MVNLPHDREYEARTPHIASPDVHVDETNRRIVMYFHGLEGYAKQVTRVAFSSDGISFKAVETVLCPSYLRVVKTQKGLLGMTMPGDVYWPTAWDRGFAKVTRLFNPNFRHHALLSMRDWVFVFWTEVGEVPESIKVSLLEIGNVSEHSEPLHQGILLKPELAWEGSEAPLEPSVRSVTYG